MQELYDKFYADYVGKPNTGNTPENKGECVGLIAIWNDILNLPHIWGHAKDLLANADKNFFQLINNSPDNSPLVGDIVVWDETWGNGFGHTGVVKSATLKTLTVFEQNNPVGSPPILVTHKNYNGVKGWLRPIKNQEPMATITQRELDQMRKDRDDNHNRAVAAEETVKNLNETITNKNSEIARLTQVNGSQQEQITKLTAENEQLKQDTVDFPITKKALEEAEVKIGERDTLIQTLTTENKKLLENSIDGAKVGVLFSAVLKAILEKRW